MRHRLRILRCRGPSPCRPGRRYWLLYDGQCAFCRSLVALVSRLDLLRCVVPMDFHHHLERAVRRAPSLDRESLARAVHLLSPEGEVWMGFEAVRRLARLFPALWPLLPVLHAPGASRTGRVLYEWIARNRYRLGGCGPDAACHARFRRPGKPA